MSLLIAEFDGNHYGLGRIPSLSDRRNFLMEDLLPTTTRPPRTKVWTPGRNLDQGSTPSCTGHAARGWELSSPIIDAPDMSEANIPDPKATEIWTAAQIAEFGHADPNDGATIHGIAKVLHDPLGILSVGGKARMRSYVWAKTLRGALYYVTYRGPLIIGISWYNSMFNPGQDGVLTVDVNSGLAGGHAICVYGIDMEKSLIGPIRNSWGRGWGRDGDFFLTFNDAQNLLFDDNGEVCAGIEQTVKAL